MGIIKKIFITLLVGLLVLPMTVKADEKTYNTLNLREALKEEEIEETFKNYKETDDQITIYLFRGKGCGFCRKFLTFLNSITDEYGKYFKVVSYEVWNDSKNAELMENVSKYLNEPANGVPYIIIGDKVFGGYAESYDEDIKNTIKKLYDTKKEDRYDVMEEYEKNGNKTEESSTSFGAIAFNVILTLALVSVVAIYDSKKRIDLENRIKELEEKVLGKKANKNEE